MFKKSLLVITLILACSPAHCYYIERLDPTAGDFHWDTRLYEYFPSSGISTWTWGNNTIRLPDYFIIHASPGDQNTTQIPVEQIQDLTLTSWIQGPTSNFGPVDYSATLGPSTVYHLDNIYFFPLETLCIFPIETLPAPHINIQLTSPPVILDPTQYAGVQIDATTRVSTILKLVQVPEPIASILLILGLLPLIFCHLLKRTPSTGPGD